MITPHVMCLAELWQLNCFCYSEKVLVQLPLRKGERRAELAGWWGHWNLPCMIGGKLLLFFSQCCSHIRWNSVVSWLCTVLSASVLITGKNLCIYQRRWGSGVCEEGVVSQYACRDLGISFLRSFKKGRLPTMLSFTWTFETSHSVQASMPQSEKKWVRGFLLLAAVHRNTTSPS